VISFVNPRNTIRQIAQSNSMSEFQIRKIAYSLLQAGLVEVIRPPRAVPTVAATPGEKAAGVQAAATQMRPPAVKRSLVHKLIDRIREL
jgi:hypothetical protein